MILRLHVYEDGVKTNVIQAEAEKARIQIGREEENVICITHIVMSRKHCEIVIDGEMLAVRDLESIYGTYLNQNLVGKKGNNSGKFVQMKEGACLKLAPNFKLYVECVQKNASKQKTCLMCGKPFYATNAGQEFCFDCRLEMELQMGLEKNEALQTVQVLVAEEESKIISIQCKELQKSEWKIKVRKPVSSLKTDELVPGYKKIKKIGGKSPYVVYLAEEKATGKRMAIKTLTEPVIKKEVFQRAFELQKELERQKVEVVKVHKVGEYNGIPYMIMEYYEAGNIVDFYHNTFKHNRFGGARALLMKMLLSLHHLHHAKLKVGLDDMSEGFEEQLSSKAHLRIKPNNFLVELDEKKNAKILIADFGLMDGISDADQTAENFAFMSREQVVMALDYSQFYGFFKPVYDSDIFYDLYGMLDRSQWDVWAATAIAYFMLTGHYPKEFADKENPEDVVLNKKVTPIWAYDYKVPAEFARIIDLALKDHVIGEELYFESAEKLIRALQKIQI